MRAARHFIFASKAQGMPQDEDKPRITSNVRTSLKLLKHFKSKMQEAAAGPKLATSYRRKKPDKQEQQEQRQDHGDHGSLYDFRLPPILLVDGYNVCGTWEKLKDYWSKDDLLTAREVLIGEVHEYVLLRGYRTMVVFDAYNSGLPFHRSISGCVEVVYATECTADKWIEHEIRVLRQEGYKRITVVSSDAFHRLSSLIEGAQRVWSSDRFIQSIEANKVSKPEPLCVGSRTHSMRLGYTVSGNVTEKLLDLKRSLKQAEQAEKQRLKNTRKSEQKPPT